MTQKFTAEEVRENIAANRRYMTTETELQLTAYADTLSKQASPLSAFVNAPHDEKQWIGQQVAARVDEMMDEPADSGRVVDADSIALEAAHEISLMWGQDRSQFVAKIQVRVIAAISAALAAQGQGDANDKHEREMLAVIDERDRREEIIDCLCDAVLGQGRPEWSSAYGYDDALLEVQEAMFAPPASPAGVPDLVRFAIERCLRSQEALVASIDKANPDDPYASVLVAEDIEYLRAWLAAAPSAPDGDGGCEVNTAAAYLADLLRTLDDAFITRGSQLRNWTLHVNTFPPSQKESEMARCNCSPRCDVCGDGPCDCTCTKAEKMTLHDRVEFALRDAGFGLDESSQIATLAEAHLAKPAVTEGE